MTARAYIVEGKAPRTAGADEAADAIGKAHFVWVHLNGTDTGAHEWLVARKLDPLVIGALLAAETRPRLDVMNGGALLNLRGPDASKAHNPDLLASARMWIAHGWVVSVTMHDLAALDTVEEKIKAGEVTDPGDFVSAMSAAITEELDPDVAALGDMLDDCEEMFAPNNALQLRRTIAKARAKAIAYRRFVAPQRTALERLSVVTADWLDDSDRQQLRDVADRAARMAEELEAIRERAALIHEQLTDLRAELIDTRTLVISIVALVFLPLTFLTGLLGMNVAGIPYAHEPWAFWAVVGVCVAVAVGVAIYFIRARWFR